VYGFLVTQLGSPACFLGWDVNSRCLEALGGARTIVDAANDATRSVDASRRHLLIYFGTDK